MWRPFAVDLAICVRRTFELPYVEPQLLGRAPGGFGVEHAIVRDDALEAIGVAENPVNHVAAVTGTQRALAVLVDEGIGFLSIIEAEHQIFERSAAPIAVDGVRSEEHTSELQSRGHLVCRLLLEKKKRDRCHEA